MKQFCGDAVARRPAGIDLPPRLGDHARWLIWRICATFIIAAGAVGRPCVSP